MYTVVVEFHIKPPYIAAFHQAIVENARLSVENEPGCHQFDVCCDKSDQTLFYLYEIYDNEAAFQAHLKTPHFLSMNSATSSWVDSKNVRIFMRVQP